MGQCTAPTRGHRTASGRAACPACGGGYGSSYSSYSSPYPTSNYSGGGGGSFSSGRKRKSSWSKPSSTVLYTPAQVQALKPVRESVERRAALPDLRDLFLCHAWDDRKGAAKQLNELLESKGVSVWFSEKDILLGSSFLREIDKGLANSRVGLVLVTPSFLERVRGAGIAEKELSVLLRRNLLVPVLHGTTFDELCNVSPLLGSRDGLDTAEDSMDEIAAKLAELVSVDED